MADSDQEAILLYGQARPPREPVQARAGRVRFVFEDGMIKHLRVGRVELVRRVYFGVRTDQWDTVHPAFSDVRVEATSETFRASWQARCTGGAVDYMWHGVVEGDADGTIHFTAEGEPLADFGSNRVGLCLLLSARGLAGMPFTPTKADGSPERGTFSRYVDPGLLATRFTSIRYQPPGGPMVQCDIQGAVFDMEDQRLYMDTTYKAYAPLPYRYPQVRRGERFSQTWTFRLVGSPAAAAAVAVPDEPVTVEIGRPIEAARIPGLGLTLNTSDPLSDDEVADLAAMELAHLRLELDATDPRCEGQVGAALPVVATVTSGLLLSVRNLSETTVGRLGPMVARVADSPIERLWVEACDARPELLSAIRREVESDRIDVRVGGPGSAAVSAHPHLRAWAAAGPDFLCWAGSPAIHQEDDETLMENTAGLAEQIEAVRQYAGDVPLAAGPFQLNGAWPRPRPDARHTGLFAAAWMASLIKHLAESGVNFATLFDAVGPAGAIYRPAPFAQPGFDGTARRRYSVYDCIAWFSRSGGAVMEARSSDPLRVEALAVRAERRGEVPVVILINKTFRLQAVRLEGVGGPRGIYLFTGASAGCEHDWACGRRAGVYAGSETSSLPVSLPAYGLAWLVPEE